MEIPYPKFITYDRPSLSTVPFSKMLKKLCSIYANLADSLTKNELTESYKFSIPYKVMRKLCPMITLFLKQ